MGTRETAEQSIATDLLSAGCQIDHQDSLGNTALHYAAQSQKGSICHFLLLSGGNGNLKNNHDYTALDLAIAEHGYSVTCLLLTQFRCETNDQMNDPQDLFDKRTCFPYSEANFKQKAL